MIVDEFHEFTSKAPMFCLIGDLLRARLKCASPTLLMSATPIKGIEKVWFPENSINNVTMEAPVFDNNIHIKLVHSVPEAKEFLGGIGCYIANTVGNCQKLALSDLEASVIHGGYSQDDKTRKLTELISVHGKEHYAQNSSKRLTASGIVQASLNISFPAMMDSLASPEATVQRIGRLGRFDSSDCRLAILSLRDRGDVKMIEEAYSIDISDYWLKAIALFLGESQERVVSRSDFLNFYRDFCDNNKKLYENWVNELQERSIESVAAFGMYNKTSSSKRTGPMRIGMNLRGGEGHFVLVERFDESNISSTGEVLLTATPQSLRNLLEKAYRVESKRVNDYIETNRKLLKQQGLNYKPKSLLSKMGETSHCIASKSSDQPLICNKKVWGETYAVYNSRLGLVTRKDVLAQLMPEASGGSEDDFEES
ncbi:MAG: hypothetical protein NTX25_03395, partial [Proteobacteria bacterium]|nr:hypothetical protein [Pseudomonadota bacterium]